MTTEQYYVQVFVKLCTREDDRLIPCEYSEKYLDILENSILNFYDKVDNFETLVRNNYEGNFDSIDFNNCEQPTDIFDKDILIKHNLPLTRQLVVITDYKLMAMQLYNAFYDTYIDLKSKIKCYNGTNLSLIINPQEYLLSYYTDIDNGDHKLHLYDEIFDIIKRLEQKSYSITENIKWNKSGATKGIDFSYTKTKADKKSSSLSIGSESEITLDIFIEGLDYSGLSEKEKKELFSAPNTYEETSN